MLDRTELILDIFASRAQTHEARLAVELAQLEYSLPRLKRMWTHLSRIKMGIGMRGPGEKQLEDDRRLVEKRIHDLQARARRDRSAARSAQVAGRRDRMTVSLVGYTNAGKSTLMNALTGADVLAEDKLFATLDTRTRRWQLPGWGPVLLSDTVGFIRDLPHHLIASFKATLEEARQADLLLHVADASNPRGARPDRRRVRGARGAGHRGEGHAAGAQQGRPRRPTRRALAAIRNRYPHAVDDQRPHGRRPVAAGRRGERRAEPGFLDLDIHCDVERRPAAGVPRQVRRGAQPHVHRRPGVDPLPHRPHAPGPIRETPASKCIRTAQRRRDSARRQRRRRAVDEVAVDREAPGRRASEDWAGITVALRVADAASPSPISRPAHRRLQRHRPRAGAGARSPRRPLLLTARREELLQAVADECAAIGGAAEFLAGDVTDAAYRAALDRTRRRTVGRPRRAGQQRRRRAPTAGSPTATKPTLRRSWRSILRRRRADAPRAAALCTQAAAPAIVNIGSIIGHRGLPLNSEYSASKFALRGWSEALRAELAADGIDVLLVSPGTTDTEFFDHLVAKRAALPGASRRPSPAAAVAEQTVRALERDRREIFPNWRGRAMVLANRAISRRGRSRDQRMTRRT